MELCAKNHDEVCFETRYCPACEAIDALQDQIQALERQLENAGA
jgi:hypothetical protein